LRSNDAYILKDCGSTSGTLLNGRGCRDKPVEIRDRDVISFARYRFTFLYPGSLYDTLLTS
jgi:pSer/pThr/pTyr-binding forkhead associated (FHA) protein